MSCPLQFIHPELTCPLSFLSIHHTHAKMLFRRRHVHRGAKRGSIRRKFVRRGRTLKSYPFQSLLGTTLSSSLGLSSGMNFMRQQNRLNAFPIIMRCELPYSDAVAVSSVAGIASSGTCQQWKLNDLFDPYLTGAGHQPRYFDQLTGQYIYYKVMECAWRITFAQPSTTTCWGGVTIQPYGDTLVPTNQLYQTLAEQRGTRIIPHISADGTSTTITGHCKMWELEGIPFAKWDAMTQYEADISHSPTNVPTLSVFLGDFAAPISLSSCNVIVDLIYKCKFWGQKTPAIS